MTVPIRVGLIGANPEQSWASVSHLPAIQALPQFKLVAVSTTRQDTAEQAAKRFGAPLAFHNAHDLVTHPDVDMVTVAVKVSQHHELVLAALNAGKHVYCEWPLGNGLEQSIEMAALARKQKVRTAIGLQGRASPGLNTIRELVAAGKLGRILSSSVIASSFILGPTTTARLSYTVDRRNGATMLTIMLGHLMDSVLYALGDVTELSALLATQRKEVKVTDTGATMPVTASDQIIVSGRLKTGAVASLHMRGGLSRATNLLWEVNGTEGDLLVTADDPQDPHLHFGRLRVKIGRGSATALEDVPVSEDIAGVPAQLRGGPAFNVACQYALFAKDILEGTHLCADFDDAVQRHRLLEDIEKSHELGQRVAASG
jgi:predicted dehydrogenase